MRFFSLEALRSIRGNAAISFAATMTVLIAIFMLGAFIAVFLEVNAAATDEKQKLDIAVYLSPSATTNQINGVRDAIRANPHVRQQDVRFVPKDEALRDQRRRNPQLFQDLGGVNPYPDAFILKPDDPKNAPAIIAQLERLPGLLRDSTTPQGIVYDRKIANGVISGANVVKWGGLALISMLLLAAALLIGNTIRLSIFARRREVEVMKLVGATNWFIRWPFVLEGVIFGLVGAVLGVVLLVVGKFAVVDQAFSGSNSPFVPSSSTAISFPLLALILIGAGALLGAAGSGVTLRRFLRV